jgi:hypothetical protein
MGNLQTRNHRGANRRRGPANSGARLRRPCARQEPPVFEPLERRLMLSGAAGDTALVLQTRGVSAQSRLHRRRAGRQLPPKLHGPISC